MSKSKGRNLALERKWRRILRRQRASELSIRAFCREQSLSEAGFHFWKRQLRERDGQRPQSPAFVELQAMAEPSPIELVLGGDRRLLLRGGCDLQLLCRVIGALEAQPC
jgi:hypothetical protein